MNFKLTNRYILTGVLIMKTGLHIGGGKESLITDSAVIRDAMGQPFIPGSSFKGVLRSTIEKILPVFTSIPGLWSCQLFNESDEAKSCLSSTSNQKKLSNLKKEIGKKVKDSKVLSTEYKERHLNDIISEQFILETFLPENLCDTCKIFGSPVFGSKIKIQDLDIREPYFELSEVRDGVGIDRDTETAVPQVKFDFEVIPSKSEFDLKIILENVCDKELAIFAIGIKEFVEGNSAIGGLSSRGLGACSLIIDKIEFLDFTNPAHLEKYLIEGKMDGQLSTTDFFNKIKTELLTPKTGGNNA